MAASPGTFDGSVVAKAGDRVSFVVDDVHPTPISTAVPAVGSTLEVRYDADTASYLHVGVRYRVPMVTQVDGTLTSYVQRASSTSCGGTSGTIYADGRAIDTSLVSIAGVHTGGLVALAAGLVAVGLLILVVGGRRSRSVSTTGAH